MGLHIEQHEEGQELVCGGRAKKSSKFQAPITNKQNFDTHAIVKVPPKVTFEETQNYGEYTKTSIVLRI